MKYRNDRFGRPRYEVTVGAAADSAAAAAAIQTLLPGREVFVTVIGHVWIYGADDLADDLARAIETIEASVQDAQPYCPVLNDPELEREIYGGTPCEGGSQEIYGGGY